MATYNVNRKRLRIEDFQHPLDKKSVETITGLPGFSGLLEYISKHSLERVYGFINSSSRMKITPKMSPKIFGMLEEAAEMYGADSIPEVYLERSYTFCINLDGLTRPHIVLPTTWLEAVDDHMLWGVLSSQIGCIQAKHETLEFIDNVVNFTRGMLPFGIDTALDLALKDWKRNRVYTADRAILLAMEDFGAAAKHILFGDVPMHILDKMDLAKPGNPYYQQAREFLEQGGVTGKLQSLETVFSSSQWMASRYMELYNWYFGGEYHEVLERSMEHEL